MAKECLICKKGTIMGGKRNLLRGKYNPTKKVRKYPNLQWATFSDGVRKKICTSCIKKGLHLKRSSLKK
jgi:ribosomal protein L28